MYAFVECTNPKFKNALIKRIIKQYDVDLSEAVHEKPEDYVHFNDFFTRALKPGMRPLPEDNGLVVSPADGEISQIGDIEYGRVYQAKGHDYSLIELIGGDSDLGQEFMGGKFATIYLSPRDYHRVHTPFGGKLRKMVHVPGRLFSVNQGTVENIPGLFARNERVVAIYDTEYGPMAVILVGAMIVASIETVWAGLVTPERKKVRTFDYQEEPKTFEQDRGGRDGPLSRWALPLLFCSVKIRLNGWISGKPVQKSKWVKPSRNLQSSVCFSEQFRAVRFPFREHPVDASPK